jgi:hypothetical protein
MDQTTATTSASIAFIIISGGCEFGKNKHFLQVFGKDKEVRLSL